MLPGPENPAKIQLVHGVSIRPWLENMSLYGASVGQHNYEFGIRTFPWSLMSCGSETLTHLLPEMGPKQKCLYFINISFLCMLTYTLLALRTLRG